MVDNGFVPPQGLIMSFLNYIKSRKDRRIANLERTASRKDTEAAQAKLASGRTLRWPSSLKTVHIILEKDVGMVLLFNSLIYAAFYDVTASFPSLLAKIYGFNDLQVGLSFIRFGVSCSIASLLFGRLMGLNYRRVARQAGLPIDLKGGDDMRYFPIEKARVQVFVIRLYIGIACVLCWGWVLEEEAPLAARLVLSFMIGLTLTGSFNVLSTLLVDLYPLNPATATAANNLVRCLMGAAGTALIIQMIDSMGRGWCFTFIAAVVFTTSSMLWAETRWGPQWREERRVRMGQQEAEKTAAVQTEAK